MHMNIDYALLYFRLYIHYIISILYFVFSILYYELYFGYGPLPVTVTTRIITFLVGNPFKPLFATVTGRGPHPNYTITCVYIYIYYIFFFIIYSIICYYHYYCYCGGGGSGGADLWIALRAFLNSHALWKKIEGHSKETLLQCRCSIFWRILAQESVVVCPWPTCERGSSRNRWRWNRDLNGPWTRKPQVCKRQR